MKSARFTTRVRCAESRAAGESVGDVLGLGEVSVTEQADVRTAAPARPSFADEGEIDAFVATLRRFESGELDADAWRAFRLVHGTYGQRQGGELSMLRVKVPQGVLDVAQLHALADVAETWSRGFGHVTTRENVQFHFVRLHDVEPAMRRAADAGLTTREACGNAVRNVTACPYAGIAADEPFDVTPYAEALTRHLLRHPLSSTLPRKFKMAFEGCAHDHVYAAINDLGFRARVRPRPDGGVEHGFRVSVGGGTATLPVSGGVLAEFIPVRDLLAVAEAVLRVFHRLGDRQHRQRARLKFLIRAMGWDAWHAAFDAALAEVRAAGIPPLPFDPDLAPELQPPLRERPAAPSASEIARRVGQAVLRGPGLVPDTRPELRLLDPARERWVASNVRAQKQAGYACVTLTLPLGDVTGAQLRVLADLASAYADGTVRLSVDQNVLLRFVRATDVPALYERAAAAGLGRPGAHTLSDVTSCPGAESCRLAVTESRGLGRALSEHLRERPDVVAAAGGLDIKISGCPNGCGQHHVAGIGLQGSLRQVEGRALTQYFVMLGGGVDEQGRAHFGRLAAKVPVRRVPEALERLVALYVAEREPGESGAAFLRRLELARVKALLADLEAVRPVDLRSEDFGEPEHEAAIDSAA